MDVTPTVQSENDLQDKIYVGQDDEIVPVAEKEVPVLSSEPQVATDEMKAAIARYYGVDAEGEHIAPRDDLNKVLDQLLTLSEADAMEILLTAKEEHRGA